MLLESKSRGLERIFVHGLRQVQGESLPNLRLNNATMPWSAAERASFETRT